jgi:hypothetical protein
MPVAAVSIGLVLVVAAVLRRRVRERGPQESPEAYWAAAEIRGAAMVLWPSPKERASSR